MFHRKKTLNQVLKFIREADDTQINEIIQAVVHRYNRVNPDWEVSFLSLPQNDPVQRQQMLRSILQLYEQS